LRILVLGAAGFIGRHILAALIGAGHEVIGAVRHPAEIEAAFPAVAFFACDLARDVDPEVWRPRLAGIDVVVNAAGLLSGPDMEAVHVTGPAALYRAAAAAGVKRLVLISAISARADIETDYARTKLASELVLRESGLPWTLLRPSLVYAKGSYGGTSLLRGLAGLPFLVPLPGDGGYAFNPIHADDLARLVREACESDRFAGVVLEPMGPDAMSLKQLIGAYRDWLGFGRARYLPVPLPIMRFIAKLGDRFGAGPIASNSLAQLLAGNSGDAAAFIRTAGFSPRPFEAALQAEPAEVQDRWHARLFFLAPLLKATLIILWLTSAIFGLLNGRAMTAALVAALGLPAVMAVPLWIGSSLLDLAVAALLVAGRRGRFATMLQIMVVLAYMVVLSIGLPRLWLDPFGPLVKNFPILAAILVNGVLSDRR
jgi:uncharacterized protein YbjT (DUF2867 family)